MTQRIEKKRRQDIVFLNILFCMLVIFIHISSEVITRMDRGQTMFWVILVLSRLSGFVVQGFILLSGVKLFFKVGNLRYGRFYFSRLTAVVLPYILWVLIYYIYFCFKNYFTFSWAELGRFLLVGDLSAHFYFVVVIVQFYLLAPLWMLLFKKANPTVLLLVALMITVICGLSLDQILAALFPNRSFLHLDLLFLRYLFYWTAGCMIGLHYQAFQNYLRRRWLAITLLFLACSALEAGFIIRFVGNAPAWMDQIHILYSISAILFCYMLAQLFAEGGGFLIRPFRWLDHSTYHIYLIHCLIIFIANDAMSQHGIENLAVRFGWRALAAYGGSILLCLLWQGGKRCLVRGGKKR